MSKLTEAEKLGRIAVIGNYLPRQCGIATFTTDLSTAIAKELPHKDNIINVAMDDIPEGYPYPDNVKFRIRENVLADYYSAADYLNAKRYDSVILQHEYGIYGGDDGSYIIHLLKSLRMPIITNLHTVLKNPTEGQFIVIKELAKYSAYLLVMSKKAFNILEKTYSIPKSKIIYVPHGIPDALFEEPGIYNEQFGIKKDKKIILTFGLLSPGKGIENMIKAMPHIVKEHPDVVYVILGQTHPRILDASGDSYRNNLQQLVHKLGLDDYIVFHNKFVEQETLIQYLQTSTIYAIPYLSKEQITSGTLAYALGVGAAIVSTPFWHAEELLADGRGILVPFKKPLAFSREINRLLKNKKEWLAMKKKAYQYARPMTWKEVARQHLKIIARVKEEYTDFVLRDKKTKQDTLVSKLPSVELAHLKTMTDDIGIFQHAKYMVPDYNYGYCTDDNARALIATNLYYSLMKDKSVLPLLDKYLSFIVYAFNRNNGRFRNFMSFDRKWLEEYGSEDSHARTLWALGELIKDPPNESYRELAMRLFLDALPVVLKFTAPRAWAYTIIGLQSYLAVYSGDMSARESRDFLANKLYGLFRNATKNWPWCEDTLTYANAIIPHALIMAGQWVPNKKMYNTGVKALEWLLKIQTAKQGHISLIGNKTWYKRGSKKSKFDQQPIEIMVLVNACLEQYITTKKEQWLEEAERSFRWFLGENDLNIPVCNFETGGSGDGLETCGINANQGAESTLAWLISLLKMHKIAGSQVEIEKRETGSGGGT